MGLLGVAMVAYAVWWVLFAHTEAYRGRFLLTVTVEVDGERRTGESVYEVAYNHYDNHSRLFGPVIMGERGTTPWVDLGEHGTLLLLFAKPFTLGNPHYQNEFEPLAAPREPKSCLVYGPINLPTVGMVPQERRRDWSMKRKVKHALRRTERIELTAVNVIGPDDPNYPAVNAVLYRPDQPRSYRNAFPLCDLQRITRGAAHVVGLTIENTERELHTRIPGEPDWMQRLRRQYFKDLGTRERTYPHHDPRNHPLNPMVRFIEQEEIGL